MKKHIKLSLSHSYLKIDFKQAAKIINVIDVPQQFDYSCDNYNISFVFIIKGDNELAKALNSLPNENLNFYFSKKEIGLYFKFRLPISAFFNAKQENLKKQLIFDNEFIKCIVNISFLRSNIIHFIKEQQAEKKRDAYIKKAYENNHRTQYVCHNPKPYQGGSFSSK